MLFLAPQPFYQQRGVCIAQERCLTILGDHGARVDVLTFPGGADRPLPGIRILRLPKLPGLSSVPIGPSRRKAVLDLALLAAAFLLCLRRRYDVVHACEEAFLLAALLKPLFRFRLLYDMDDVLSLRLLRSGFLREGPALNAFRRAETMALRSADVVVTNDRETSAFARRFLPPERVYTYHHAPPLPPRTEWSEEEFRRRRRESGLDDDKVVVYAGNLAPYQGVDVLVDSLPSVLSRIPRTRCLIIGGEPAQIERLRARAEALGVGGSLTCLGQRPLEESYSLMRLADALVSPLTEEKAVPMKVYSYLAARRPIVATRLQSHLGLLTPESAVLVGSGTDALARGLALALSRPPRHEPALGLPSGTSAAAVLRAAYARLGWALR